MILLIFLDYMKVVVLADANYRYNMQSHRDVSAWYHVVVAFDTTQATSSNRIKAYVRTAHK
jgi:hypothetical protein